MSPHPQKKKTLYNRGVSELKFMVLLDTKNCGSGETPLKPLFLCRQQLPLSLSPVPQQLMIFSHPLLSSPPPVTPSHLFSSKHNDCLVSPHLTSLQDDLIGTTSPGKPHLVESHKREQTNLFKTYLFAAIKRKTTSTGF